MESVVFSANVCRFAADVGSACFDRLRIEGDSVVCVVSSEDRGDNGLLRSPRNLRLGIFFEDFGLRERILARRGSSRKLTTLNGPIVCFLMYIPSFFLLLFLSFEGSVDGTTSFLFLGMGVMLVLLFLDSGGLPN